MQLEHEFAYCRSPRVLAQRPLALRAHSTIVAAAIDPTTPLSPNDCWLVLSHKGQQFELNQFGALVWEQLSKPASVADLIVSLNEYVDARDDDLEKEISSFLSRLGDLGLVRGQPTDAQS